MMNKGHFFNITLLIALVAALLPVGAMAAPPDPADKARGKSDVLVERGLQAQLIEDETTGYMIYFHERPDLSPAYKMDWESRGHFVVEALQKTAERAQADVRAYLDAQGGKYQAFWIDNVIVVEASNAETFNGLMSFSEIEALRARRQPFLHEPVSSEPIRNAINAVESNLTHINVDDAWAMGHTGQNIVVANIDTGARYTHEALVDHYRGNLGGSNFSHDYNWYDPYDFSASPNDPDTSSPTHGSHTMGTIVGDDGNTNQIGVAPGAEWYRGRAPGMWSVYGCANRHRWQ
jgi:subtilisin family serine protease